ncbi:MAG: putative zinc-binding metallopeptidase [Prosthecobacter sp.]|jgi:hypothetical protein|uniref:zinc-binding metallopeptidase family protein n=1 Tax=Prosthecobacter sp. TaxID=1965333 RepID=UPI0019FC71DA|nr:putative zinc-binding metallopeptidase [Prosthecobacter sp.]MBE2287049.1 putative zinc-binding metallopeptidase [Prosthecobacter sp.]
MIHFRCTCGNALFFENTACLQCGAAVGYDPGGNEMRPQGGAWALCRNGTDFVACNWLVPAGDPAFCAACRLNRTVPDLTVPEALQQWRRMEAAKRRVIYSLLRLGIAPVDQREDESGLLFDFLAPVDGQPVITGHKEGVITLNILEADDVYRERERHALGEPYRTLVGHFRHELGHYYWDRFLGGRDEGDPLLAEFRTLFGDEREDYAAALERHYSGGPPAPASATHISSYAAAHPWEDWAETWAQYLHVLDGVETAQSFGWASENIPLPFTPFTPAEVLANGHGASSVFLKAVGRWVRRSQAGIELVHGAGSEAEFLDVLNRWARLSPALNELAASLGHATFNPFVLSVTTVRKILFVHKVTSLARKNSAKSRRTRPAAASRKPAAAT